MYHHLAMILETSWGDVVDQLLCCVSTMNNIYDIDGYVTVEAGLVKGADHGRLGVS